MPELEGHDEVDVDALGHSTLAVTDRYLRDVAPQAVIDAQSSRHRPVGA